MRNVLDSDVSYRGREGWQSAWNEAGINISLS